MSQNTPHTHTQNFVVFGHFLIFQDSHVFTFDYVLFLFSGQLHIQVQNDLFHLQVSYENSGAPVTSATHPSPTVVPIKFKSAKLTCIGGTSQARIVWLYQNLSLNLE